MSADAYVASSRLRAPANLSSRSFPGRRSAQHRLLTSSAAYRGWRGDEREGDPALAVPNLDSDAIEHPGEGSGDMRNLPDWIDMDRYEDWDRPTLSTLCPTVRIAFEEDLFPIAVAEDGESLPAEIHPSHPYGNLHQTTASYISRPKIPATRGLCYHNSEEIDGRNQLQTESAKMPAHLALRARQEIAPNAPTWPFKRFGPGPGGVNGLTRGENTRPWRPYKAVWTDLGLEELLPQGGELLKSQTKWSSELDTEQAYLPREGEISNAEIVLQEMEEFDAQLPIEERDLEEPERDKKKRRGQNEWKWGQRAGSRSN